MGALRKFVTTVLGHAQAGEKEKAVETTIESGVTGIALGAISANRTAGLDVTTGAGRVMPLDAIGGGIGLAGAVFAPDKFLHFIPGGRERLRRVAGHAFAIGMFRKAEEVFKAKKTGGGSKPKVAGDPVLEAARHL